MSQEILSTISYSSEILSVQDAKKIIRDQHDSMLARSDHLNDIEQIIYEKSELIDQIISKAWIHFITHHNDLALIAVGGYGRGELFPYSDIDLLILKKQGDSSEQKDAISKFITYLWDIGLEVGQSVRTINECIELAKTDLTIYTTLMETRILIGNEELYQMLNKKLLNQKRIWPVQKFFEAKKEEQHHRHLKYHDTAYNLEPSVKGGLGGLRDIQVMGWIGKRFFSFSNLDGLFEHALLTKGQIILLKNCQKFLWRVRFALHLMLDKKEDRLLFEHQIKVSKFLGYDGQGNEGIEAFMQRYYQTVMEVSRLNDIVMSLFEERLLPKRKLKATSIDEHFEIKNGFLEVRSPHLFAEKPSLMLALFATLEKNIDLRGIGPRTIGIIKRNLWLIDDDFKADPENKKLFLEILGAPTGVSRSLKHMNAYGILGAYIPNFQNVVGRMQFDLFHAYTVDAHTLFVVENLRRFSLERFNDEYPLCSSIMQSLERPELAYLSGLFHDIAKGRGGDHSELGAIDAENFCLNHGFSKYESGLVAWLVQHHLLLSVTAQKKDLNDPGVIKEFAEKVGDETHLNYLYLLTVADVRGTNPNLWNSWKDSLFRELYEKTRSLLRRGLDQGIDYETLIKERKISALPELSKINPDISIRDIENLWGRLEDTFFTNQSVSEIVWLTDFLLTNDSPSVRPDNLIDDKIHRLAILAPISFPSFARVTAIIEQVGLNILDVKFNHIENNNLDIYYFSEPDPKLLVSSMRMSELTDRLNKYIVNDIDKNITLTRKPRREVKSFKPFVRVKCFNNDKGQTILELSTLDRPGILNIIANEFEKLQLKLINAKISTLGEKVDDIFFITDRDGFASHEGNHEKIERAIEKALALTGD
ncbi:MAG: [protein-PII] uridylyltransferase [Gammaproteobacteria bacterium]